MEQKKFFQIAIIIIVVAVWIFSGSLIVTKKLIDKKTAPSSASQSQVVTAVPSTEAFTTTTTVPSTTAPVISTTAPKVSFGGNNVETSVTVGDPDWLIAQKQEESLKASEEASRKEAEEARKNCPSSKKDIVNAYLKGVNDLKNSKDFNLSKDDKLNITIDDLGGGNIVKTAAQEIIDSRAENHYTFDFSNGTNEEGKTPMAVIAPLNKEAAVDFDAVKTAVSKPTADGGFIIKITFVDEVQTNTAPAKNHDTMLEVIDVSSFLPSGAKVNDLNICYSGSSIEAVFNKDRKITSMKHYLEVSKATFSGSFSFIKATGELSGNFTSNYTVNYTA